MCWISLKRKRNDSENLEVEIIAQRGPVGVGKAIASVDGKRAVTCEIKFAVEQ